jgi:hypothetical protein
LKRHAALNVARSTISVIETTIALGGLGLTLKAHAANVTSMLSSVFLGARMTRLGTMLKGPITSARKLGSSLTFRHAGIRT